MATDYLSIHILHSPPPCNPNRGEDGAPKTMPLGNTQRYVLSSQAQKRAARQYYAAQGTLPRESLATRSRCHHLEVAQALIDTHNAPPERADIMARLVMDILNVGTDNLFKGLLEEDGKNLLFLCAHEVKAIAQIAVTHYPLLDDLATRALEYMAMDKAARKAYKALPAKRELAPIANDLVRQIKEASLGDVALFGRMMATLTELSVDGCIQVQYALSVNPAPRGGYRSDKGWVAVNGEPDFFSAVDDLNPNGAGHIGHRVMASPCYYRYANIALHELKALVGDDDAAMQMARAFTKAFSLTLPTGYKTATAHQCAPDLVLLRRQPQGPLSFAPAFEAPIEQSGGIVKTAAQRLLDYEQYVVNAFDYRSDCRAITGTPFIVGDAGEPLSIAIGRGLS